LPLLLLVLSLVLFFADFAALSAGLSFLSLLDLLLPSVILVLLLLPLLCPVSALPSCRCRGPQLPAAPSSACPLPTSQLASLCPSCFLFSSRPNPCLAAALTSFIILIIILVLFLLLLLSLFAATGTCGHTCHDIRPLTSQLLSSPPSMPLSSCPASLTVWPCLLLLLLPLPRLSLPQALPPVLPAAAAGAAMQSPLRPAALNLAWVAQRLPVLNHRALLAQKRVNITCYNMS